MPDISFRRTVRRFAVALPGLLIALVIGFTVYMSVLGPRYDLGRLNVFYDWYYTVSDHYDRWRFGDLAEPSVEVAEGGDEQPDLADLLVDADPARGERVYRKCVACHRLDGVHGAGPALNGVVGQAIGQVPGYAASEALRQVGGIWTPEVLSRYLTNPKAFVPGTTMAFAGLRKAQDRADVIVYLMQQGGVIADTDDAFARAQAQLSAQLRKADVAFNRPSEMVFGKTSVVELVLVPQPGEAETSQDAPAAVSAPAGLLSDGLRGETVEISGIRYSVEMQATLSGADFEIGPEGPLSRTVAPGLHATWVWDVRPRAFGADLPLRLELVAIVEDGTGRRSEISAKALTEHIFVDVSGWDWLVHHAADIKAVHGIIVAVGGTVMAVLGWLWKRRRKAAGP